MKRSKKSRQIERMETAGQALIEQAYILCSSENRTYWEVRNNSATLLERAREYTNAVRLVSSTR